MLHIYLCLFFTVLIIIIIVAFVFMNRKRRIMPIQENFGMEIFANNLLTNSSFQNGSPPGEFTDSIGNNEIIVFPNNGQSSYTLRINKDNKIKTTFYIYYSLEVELKANTTYYLGCLYYSPKNSPLVHRVKFMNESPIYLKTMNESRYTSPVNCNFQYKYTLFKTPEDPQKIKTIIDIGYRLNDNSSLSYITDIGLFQISDTSGIPVTENLRSHFNVFNSQSVKDFNPLIKDISGNGHDFNATRSRGIKTGSINLTQNTLTGNNAFTIQNENSLTLKTNFSIFIFAQSSLSNNVIVNENFNGEFYQEEEQNVSPDDIKGAVLFEISGNQGYAIRMYTPDKYGRMYIIAGNKAYQTTYKFPSFIQSMLALVYDGEKIKLYLDQVIILETVCPKIYFDNKGMKLNPNNDFNGEIFAFAYYNTNLSDNQVRLISRYFTRMKALGKEIMSFNTCSLENLNSFIIPAPGKIISKKIILEKEQEKLIQESNNLKDSDKNKYCPKVIHEDGHFYVVVSKDSALCKKIGYYGLRDYGTNIDTAKQIFETNFPNCPIPKCLDKRQYEGDIANCPFIMLVPENPCKNFECKDACWEKGTVKNENCKNNINAYCAKYADLDPACYCWKKENLNKADCLKWRGKFDSHDKCDFRKYPINKHPEFSNYIKKDNIPCWGCNLDGTSSTNPYNKRKGSGAR